MSKLLLKISLAVMLVFCASFSYAEQKAAQKPVQIEADNMKYFGDKMMSKFTGNVVVTNDGMTMTSDEMEVFFTENREVKEILSRGNVKIEKGDLLAMAGKAKLYQKEQKILLTENARIWQGENYLEGETITLFNESDRLFVDKGDDDKRVKIIIAPQKESQ